MAYTTKAVCSGGRAAGRSVLQNGGLALAMAFPKEMGGDGNGHNPEQLFALGWAACFNQAVLALAKKHDLDGQSAKVGVEITIDKDSISFSLSALITLHIPGADTVKVEALIQNAHEICPYSRATRNNVPVTLSVV